MAIFTTSKIIPSIFLFSFFLIFMAMFMGPGKSAPYIEKKYVFNNAQYDIKIIQHLDKYK